MRGSGACASWSILMVVIVVAIVGRHCSGRGLRNRRRVHVAHAIGVDMCGATLRDRNAGRWKVAVFVFGVFAHGMFMRRLLAFGIRVSGRLATAVGMSAAAGDQLLVCLRIEGGQRSEEHTSELQSLMRISYAVFCLKKKK